eukprot:3335513-Pyramimonas_sp.AAC.1
MMMMMMMMMMMTMTMMMMRKGSRRRMRTSASQRLINDVGIHPPSNIPRHRLLQGVSLTEGIAPVGDNRVNSLKRAKTPFSRLQRHALT